ncbi:MAG: carbohydrate-binding protein, partial [Oscillospiraceae bacterium]|nr:carbohydrate-binding protein [Oscillospiraceae bacterium]
VRISRAEKRVLVISNVGDQMGSVVTEYHKPGELVTIDAKSRPGYTFDGWQVGIDAMDVTRVSADGTVSSFIMPEYNQRIQAKWKLNGSRVNVAGIRLNQENLSLDAGETSQIKADVFPENATDKVVIWTSSNPLVASVDKNGVVTALSDGTAEILARTLEPNDKQFTAKCKVSVTGSIEPAEPIPFGERIEAESYTTQSGVDTESCSEGGKDVAYIENGDYIGFKNVDFGEGAECIDFRVGSNGGNNSIEVHIGSPNGKIIGTMNVNGTGGWQTWKTQKCSIDKTSGVNDIYLVFKGGDGYLFNLNWFCINNNVIGDCNADGKFTIADAVMLQQWILAVHDAKLTDWKAADLCEDDIIDIFDFVAMKRMLISK